jgi:zinc/manganese transport system substrate-binding protein
VRVVAAENFWGSIARQIAGPDAAVTSLVSNPGTDPHSYEPTPADARAIASARLVIVNGIGYDPWAQQLLDADNASGRVVLDVGALVGVPAGGNPHQWYAHGAVLKVIDRVARDLATVDPRHRTGYEARARSLVASGLAEYNALTTETRRTYAGVAIGGSESIVAVWASALGLRLVTPRSFVDAIAEGSEPTASDKATVDAQIKRHEIAVFVFNSQNLTPDVQRLVGEARSARIPVVAVTETLVPEGATFQQWQVRELRELLAALEKAER